jgi:predicted  nucleic acid-binding Zn-ribbon protein
LTKVLIVLMAVCSVVASVVFIQYSNTTANYKEAYESELEKAKALQANLSAELATQSALKEALNAQKTNLNAELQGLKDKLDEATKQISECRQSIAMLTNEKVNLQASNASLTTTLGQQTARADQLARQLEERQALVQTQNGQLQEQDTRIKDLVRERDHATEAAQKKDELAVAMENRVKQLEEQIRRAGIVSASETPRPSSSEKIEGRVLDVLIDQNLAQVSVGSASGVEPGMEFILYRNSELVGKLNIAKVDATTSAGTLSDLQLTPQKGDIATTRLTTK